MTKLDKNKEQLNNTKKSNESFLSKAWKFIKKLYRPLYNLLVYIAALLIKLVFALARAIVNILVKPILSLLSVGSSITETINNWLKKQGNINIKFSLSKDLSNEIQETGFVISKLLKWIAFSGCVRYYNLASCKCCNII